ncbi:hypothetical protein CXB51_031771 [Gossypium anomalum]|uniref:Uncharacterized protein n=1 Tax=Gossypium anomalum TaxID=47600 RepID=A0A8J5Y7F4_9ROSI|nr:hypothetical protein CXB51_031771 [Gossypium anomalum]
MDPKSLCGLELYNNVLMRYVKASSAYLGKQEDVIDFDITCYRSKDPMAPRLYQDVYKNGGEFLKVKNTNRPLRLFSSEWADQVLGQKKWVHHIERMVYFGRTVYLFPRCLLCSEQGLSCRPGKAFTDARVCAKN